MASWKKVIVSGSNADLAQITSSAGIITAGDLNVSGNSFLGNSKTGDKIEISGSTELLGKFKVSKTEGIYGVAFDVNENGNTFINPQGQGYYAFIGTNSFYTDQAGSNADLSIKNYDIVSNKSLVLGHQQTNAAWGKALTVTGSTNITGSLNIDGTLTVTGDTLQEDLQTTGTTQLGNDMSDKTEVTGSFNVTGSSFFQGSGIFSGSNGTVTIDPYGTTVIDIQDTSGGTLEALKFRTAAGGDQIRLTRNGGQNSLELLDNGGNSVSLNSKNPGFYLNNFAIGASSADANNTLSVTGNAKVTTGITGSYLTDNKLLTAGSVGQIESSAITWDDTTLTVGSSGAGHVYATQVTASEVKISSLAADRIVFVNSTNQLEDSANLQYDDDGGLNVGGKLSLTGDLIVSHNLTVQGTASFQNTEDLDVKDRFIRMASGSTTTGDGGFAVQQTGPLDTEGFGYDSALQRWGVTSSFDASQNALNPAAFMPMTINGTENVPTSNQVANETRYKKAGNMYIDTNASMEEGGVWIYV
jgi:hypothetical protein